MKLEHHQAGARFESLLLQSLPRMEKRSHAPVVPADSQREQLLPRRILLKMPGVTMPGTAAWRRPYGNPSR